MDISNPEAPKIVVNLPSMNSIAGPPTNLAITPDQKLAIVANTGKSLKLPGQPASVRARNQ